MSFINPYVDKILTGIMIALGIYSDLFLNPFFQGNNNRE